MKIKILQLSKLLKLFFAAALFFFLAPENASAIDPYVLRMPKYSLTGNVSLMYDSSSVENNDGTTSDSDSFTQNYTLNFRSYIYSPRLMYYTINTGLTTQDGDMYTEGSTTTYGFGAYFLPYNLFNFSLHASSTEGPDYESTSYGLSMSYARRQKLKRVKVIIPVEEDTNTNANANANTNANAEAQPNANVNENENININETADQNENVTQRVAYKLTRAESLLPTSAYLDVNRSESLSDDTEYNRDNAAVRLLGDFKKTSYLLDLDYYKWEYDDGSESEEFTNQLITKTRFNGKYFQNLDNTLSYLNDGEDSNDYNINSLLWGLRKEWRYSIVGDYSLSSNSESQQSYTVRGNIDREAFLYKGVKISYGFGAGVQDTEEDDPDYFGLARTAASKKLGKNVNIQSSLSLNGGTEGIGYSSQTGVSYTFRPRKGYTAKLDISPDAGTLTAETLRPQAIGWDYSITTGYSFGISRFTGIEDEEDEEDDTDTNEDETVTNHRGDLGISVYLRILRFSSHGVFEYSPQTGKKLTWDSSLYSGALRKITITLGATFRKEMPEDDTETTTFSAYNTIGYRIARNASLRMDSKYTRETPEDSTSLETGPALLWRWRAIYIDFSLKYRKEKEEETETTERQIYLKVSRPFKIL